MQCFFASQLKWEAFHSNVRWKGSIFMKIWWHENVLFLTLSYFIKPKNWQCDWGRQHPLQVSKAEFNLSAQLLLRERWILHFAVLIFTTHTEDSDIEAGTWNKTYCACFALEGVRCVFNMATMGKLVSLQRRVWGGMNLSVCWIWTAVSFLTTRCQC